MIGAVSKLAELLAENGPVGMLAVVIVAFAWLLRAYVRLQSDTRDLAVGLSQGMTEVSTTLTAINDYIADNKGESRDTNDRVRVIEAGVKSVRDLADKMNERLIKIEARGE